MKRPSWDEYFLEIAKVVATRCTCDRGPRKGCVLVRDKRILATGYGGSPPGKPHCDEVGHLMVGNHCVRTIHAERNALNFAARQGVSVEGATAYVTQAPCYNCAKDFVSAGIKRIVVLEDTYHPEEEGMREAREDLFHVWVKEFSGKGWIKCCNWDVKFEVLKNEKTEKD